MKRILLTVCLLGLSMTPVMASAAPLEDAAPPASPVRLIFVHHSTGGNWLADPNNDQPYGGLGRALMENNYFVSATNYGWGPDGIGDRTDIPNWPEWFLGPERDRILDALYTESGQNAGDFGAWSRLSAAPDGENTIIMFKSCFPNSDLYGDPDDPPLAEPNDYDYTVANAKAVYNALLGYFETRPDKLFVVITAPPLMKSETSAGRAANARAFNDWLVNEWLAGYPLANVAVFDYYNVLTAPDNHHRWNGSAVEHVQNASSNFSAYPSGDSHPSTEGDRKATAEFVPLLNVYYNRWQAQGVQPVEPPAAEPEPVDAQPEPGSAQPVTAAGVIEDFEAGLDWYSDTGEGASVECRTDGEARTGAAGLRMTYTIPEGGWSGCGYSYEEVRDWSAGEGLSLWLRGDEVSRWVMLTLFSGVSDSPTPFEFSVEVPGDWDTVYIPWSSFERAEWADETGLSAVDPARILGFGFSAMGAGEGHLWVDDIALSSGGVPLNFAAEPQVLAEPQVIDEPQDESPQAEPGDVENAPEESASQGGLCASAPLALSLVAVVVVTRRRRVDLDGKGE